MQNTAKILNLSVMMIQDKIIHLFQLILNQRKY